LLLLLLLLLRLIPRNQLAHCRLPQRHWDAVHANFEAAA
jgi:hypothetical protein